MTPSIAPPKSLAGPALDNRQVVSVGPDAGVADDPPLSDRYAAGAAVRAKSPGESRLTRWTV